jgi:uncharacterized phage protein (predicted DNA packaging)
VTLEELKKQMRVDFDEEDSLIETYGDAAERQVISDTRRTERELLERGWMEREDEADIPDEITADYFPRRLKVAVMMLAAHLYRNREVVSSVAQNCVPYSYDVMVKPYVKLV